MLRGCFLLGSGCYDVGEFSMKNYFRLMLVGLVIYFIAKATKPVYAVSIDTTYTLYIAIGCVCALVVIVWVVLSVILIVSERGK